jgi:hypothetical protein
MTRHQTLPKTGVLVTRAVARMRWRRALVDFRSSLDGHGESDLTFKATLFSSVFFTDLILVIALFSM